MWKFLGHSFYFFPTFPFSFFSFLFLLSSFLSSRNHFLLSFLFSLPVAIFFPFFIIALICFLSSSAPSFLFFPAQIVDQLPNQQQPLKLLEWRSDLRRCDLWKRCEWESKLWERKWSRGLRSERCELQALVDFEQKRKGSSEILEKQYSNFWMWIVVRKEEEEQWK